MISKNVQKLVRRLELKKYRQREGLFVAEGPKVVGDLMRHGFCPTLVIATADWLSAVPHMPVTTAVIKATTDELRRVSFLQHPQQVLALFPLPPAAATQPPTKGRLCLALDGVQDPGNVGTIVRIADWFGIETIYCSDDTADVWSPKVVQATMGSIARVSIVYTNLKELLASAPVPIYGTLLDGDNIYQAPLTADGIIVMGNEGNGISPTVRPLISQRLLIPDFSTAADKAESLNVAIATAITCSEFRRRNNG